MKINPHKSYQGIFRVVDSYKVQVVSEYSEIEEGSPENVDNVDNLDSAIPRQPENRIDEDTPTFMLN